MTCFDIDRKFVPVALIIIIYLLHQSSSDTKSSVCKQTCGGSMNESYVTEYCQHHKLTIQDRCCVNGTGFHSIIGVDLEDCKLKTVDGLFTNLTSLHVISLKANPIHNVSSAEFAGLLMLEYLALPDNVSCPGGNEAWGNVTKTANATVCVDQLNYCSTFNVSCPKFSNCSNTGPGVTECLCLPDYHGYKCLRKGVFPGVAFASGLAGSTMVVAGCLWCIQRRKVKKNV